MTDGVPYDAEIEYLESTGTQYVDTGVLVDPTVHSFLLDCSFEGAFQNTNSLIFIDARDTNANNPIKTVTLNFGKNSSQNKTVFGWFENQGGQRNNFAKNFALERGILSYSNGVVTRNGISISVPTSSGLRERTMLLCAGRYSDNSTITAFGAYHVRVYGFTISSGSTLVRSFVPVRVGQTGYLFDRVTRRLYGNSGTGSFVLGPDVARPVLPARAVSGVSSERPFAGLVPVARNVRILPYDAEVDYVESTGTQYVDTGIAPRIDITVSGRFSICTGSPTWKPIFGSLRNNDPSRNDSIAITVRNPGNRFEISHIGRFPRYDEYEPAFGTICDFTVSNTDLTVSWNGTAYSKSKTAATTDSTLNSMYVFASRNVGSGLSGALSRWYRLSIQRNNAIVRDYIPVRVGSIGYLYDRVTRSLYDSATDTPLIAGPDK